MARSVALARCPRAALVPSSLLAFALGTVTVAVSHDARAEPPRRLDTPALFSPGGVLSPGYPAAHARATGEAPDFVSGSGWFPIAAVTLNPALATVGKLSGRLELAPLRAHALFLEVSRLDVNAPDGSFSARGSEIDIGYHLFPMEDGLRGLYLGPRYLRASGRSDVAQIEVRGWGGDVGYQIILTPLAINLGIGAAYVNAVLDPLPDIQSQLSQLTDEQRASIPTHQEAGHWIPLVTGAIGIGF